MNQILYYVLNKSGYLRGPYLHQSTAARIASSPYVEGRMVTFEAKPIAVSSQFKSNNGTRVRPVDELMKQFPEAFQ